MSARRLPREPDAPLPVAADERALLAAELAEVAPALPRRLNAQTDDVEQGLARLVLTLVEFIRQLLEHQAVRRMDGGGLTDPEIEELGLALLRLRERLDEIKAVFGLAGEELNIDLGPLGRLL